MEDLTKKHSSGWGKLARMAARLYAAIRFFRPDHGMRKMVLRQRLCAIVLAASVWQPGTASAGTPLPSLVGDKPSGRFCFNRVYDSAHLRRHPSQRTVSTLASIEYEKSGASAWLRMQLRLKGREGPANVVASCAWSETANRDTSGNRMLPAFRGEEGFVCIALYNQQSAEEAGTVLFDVAGDGKAVTVYFDDGIGLWETPEPISQLELHREDRVFLLKRAEDAACKTLEETLRPE
jgi:hypothetical protein